MFPKFISLSFILKITRKYAFKRCSWCRFLFVCVVGGGGGGHNGNIIKNKNRRTSFFSLQPENLKN